MKDWQYNWIHVIKNYYVRTYHLNDDVAAFIGCLFALESSYGENDLSKFYNNFCSMKVPFVRLSTCNNFADKDSIWAHYSTDFDCYDDFALWLQYQKPLRKQLDDVTSFPSLLRSYCPEKDYITKIIFIYSQFKLFQNGKSN